MKYIYYILLLFTISISAQEVKLPIEPISKKEFRYYYYPNMFMYFDFKNMEFIYRKNGEIIRTKEKPVIGYSIYNNYFVIIEEYTGDNILEYLEDHKKQYPYILSNKRSRK